jgi:hypothetical protein
MAKLMTIKEFCDKYFTEDSRPKTAEIKGWIENGIVKGSVINGRHYVDSYSFELYIEKPLKVTIEVTQTKRPNPILAFLSPAK